MSFASSFDDKERVRQAIDIVDLVGGYLQLRREGRGYKALCPWHDDTRPSLQVNPGAAIVQVLGLRHRRRHLQLHHEDGECRLSAKRWPCWPIAPDITLTPRQSRQGGDAGERASRPAPPAAPTTSARSIRPPHGPSSNSSDACCRDPEAESARRYLDDRGINDESIRRYHLGFSPDRWDWLIKQALRSGIFAASAGKNRAVDSPRRRRALRSVSRPRDFFDPRRARPARGDRRPSAAGERRERIRRKYVNSPETPLFSKSNMLYGLDLARDAITKSRTAVVMEGYTDCIIARQYGFENVLAVLGTALGERHIRLLRRFADRDRAGAGWRRSRAKSGPAKCCRCSWPSKSICGS